MEQEETDALREKTSRRPLPIHEESIVERLELGLNLRAFEIISNPREVGRKDRSCNRERILCARDGDDIPSRDHLTPKRGRDLGRASPDGQHRCARCTAQV